MKSAKILIVDDSSDAVRLLTRMLQQAGYAELIGVSDSREVMAIYQEWQPDLILLDLMMPFLSGLEILSQLQEIIPADAFVPVIVLTSDVTPGSKRQALSSGAQDFLLKPFDPAEVILRINNLLKTRFLHLDLQQQQQHLHKVSTRLVDAQECERRRVAHELHDEIGQVLTVVKINLQSAQRRPAIAAFPAEVEYLEESIGSINHAISRVRDLSFNLRPSMLDDFGLVETLEWCLQKAAARAPLEVHFQHDDFQARLPQMIETTCFRITQEALTNAIRHAGASHFQVKLCFQDAGLELVITDDGCGFDVESARRHAATGASMGILGMEERAQLAGGRLEVQSGCGSGTTIRTHFPAPVLAAAACRESSSVPEAPGAAGAQL